MNGVWWKRWGLGCVGVGIVPIALGGAACSDKDGSPEASAGTPSASGSASGGSSATAGAAAGNPSAGGSAAGGTAPGESECCAPENSPSSCRPDGSLKSCRVIPGYACEGASNSEVAFWGSRPCENGCGTGGTDAGAHCK